MANIKKILTFGLSRTGTAIVDVPDTASVVSATDVGTSRSYNDAAVSIAATYGQTGGLPTTYLATSTPGSFTATSTSPVVVTGLSSATAYTFTVKGVNSTGTSVNY